MLPQSLPWPSSTSTSFTVQRTSAAQSVIGAREQRLGEGTHTIKMHIYLVISGWFFFVNLLRDDAEVPPPVDPLSYPIYVNLLMVFAFISFTIFFVSKAIQQQS